MKKLEEYFSKCSVSVENPCGERALMRFEVVKQIVAYTRSVKKEHNKNFRFTLTTNGMLIDDDMINFTNRECHNVVLSLDGRKEIHDCLP